MDPLEVLESLAADVSGIVEQENHIVKVSKTDRPPAYVNGSSAGYVCKELDNQRYLEYGEACEQVLESLTADVSGIVRQEDHWAAGPGLSELPPMMEA